MTSYYKGNTIGLNYDAANATWSFTNEPNDFIDPASFSTADPAFEYAPPPSTDDDQDDDFNPCPPGYIYDSSLKQCVIDPSQQTTEYQKTTGDGKDITPVRIAGTNRTTTDNNFMATDEEYDDMSPAELLENYKQRGYVTKDDKGNLVVDLNRVDLGATIMDNLLGKYVGGDPEKMVTDILSESGKRLGIDSQKSEASARKKKLMKWMLDKQMIHSDLNPNLMNFYVRPGQSLTSENFPMTLVTGENAKILMPTKTDPISNFVSGTTKTLFTAGFGNSTYLDRKIVSRQPVFGSITTDYNKKIQSFNTASMNKITGYTKESQDTIDELDRLQKEADEERRAEKERQRTIDELDRLQKEADEKREREERLKISRDNYEREERLRKREEEKEKGTGGSWGGGQDDRPVIKTPDQPKWEPKEPAPPGEKGGGGYTYEPPRGCFHPYQSIENKFMKEFEPGDLINGKEIIGMIKLKLNEDMYSINDVKVTGSHGMKYKDKWIFVADHPDSFKIDDKPKFVYIPIIETGTFTINNEEFADYDYHDIVVLGDEEWKKRRGFSVAA